MHIEMNANGFELTDAIADHLRARIDRELGRFEDRLTRIEAHLGDHNAHKTGDGDKRCLLEARPRGLDPVAVSDEQNDLYDAISGAARKLRDALESRFGKLEDAARA